MTGCVRKKGKYYHAIIEMGTNEKGKRKQKSISTKCEKKSEAKVVLRNILTDMEGNKYFASTKETFAQFVSEYTERLQIEFTVGSIEQTTLEGYLNIIEKHIVPYFVEKQTLLKDVGSADVQKYINEKLKEKLAPSTLKKHIAVFKRVLNYACGMNLITSNDISEVSLPKIKPKEITVYSVEETKKLWQALEGNKIQTAVYLTSIFGLRRGEALGLRWCDIDFEQRTLTIRNTRTKVYKSIEKKPKSETSTRSFLLSEPVINYLKILRERQKGDAMFYGNTYNNNDYVVKAQNGKPVSIASYNENFSKVLKDNGLKHIRPHDLRHSVATVMLKHKVSLKEIQHYLGHAKMKTTSEIYLHFTDDIKVQTNQTVQQIYTS